ncbi:MAG: tetratricopeptide repeat protein, partial [Myxococcota bacterium]
MRLPLIFLICTVLAGCLAGHNVHDRAKDHTYYCARYLSQGEEELAETRCLMALEFGERYAEPHNLLGQIAMRRGALDVAETHFKHAIAVRDDFTEAYSNLGVLQQRRGDLEGAKELFRSALEVDPAFQVARLNIAAIQFRLGELDDARHSYLACLENDPTRCECHLGIGVTVAEQGNLPRARESFERATRVCPGPEAYRNLCWAELGLAQPDSARSSCGRALAIDPEHLEARELLARAQSELAKRDAALRVFQQRVHAEPQNPEPRFRLCLAHESFGQLVEAGEWCDEALQLDPTDPSKHFVAARVADRRLDAKKTRHHCQATLAHE